MKRYALNKNKFLNTNESKHLKSLIKDSSRDALLIGLALRTGARAQELLNIQKSDLDVDGKSVLIRGIKNSDDRLIPLEKTFFKKLLEYSKTIEGETLFPISYDRLVDIWNHYRPTKKKFHSLRHTFAIELYRATKDILLVKAAMGHRSLLNTMIYCDYINQTERLKDVLKATK
jgi:integrase/recombinase XerC